MADGSGVATGDAGAAATGADAGAAAVAGAGTGGAPGAGAGAGAAALAVQEAPWYGEVDQDSMGVLQKYFGADPAKADVRKSMPEFIKATRSLEKIVGDPSSRVIIPKDVNDKEGWDAFYSKLGRPADPTGYELKAGEGGDQKITDQFATIAHKHGLTKSQAPGVMQDFVAVAREISTTQQAAAEQQFLSTAQGEFDALQREWGGQADHKFAAAQRAKVAGGLDPEMMNKMERAIGTTAFLTMLSNFGMAVSEDAGSGHGQQGFSAVTPEAARARMTDMKADKAWTARYLAGGAEEVAEWSKLEKVLAKAME